MLLRNLLPKEGLCNGTRLVVKAIAPRALHCQIVGGSFYGRLHNIPRITLSTKPNELHYILHRKQFPIRPCFAMTINKSQGQSFRVVRVDLRNECFTHGQFYVAITRTSEVKSLVVMMPGLEGEKKTKNIVFPEVLKGINSTDPTR